MYIKIKQKIQVYTGLSNNSVLFESARVGRAEVDPREVDVDCLKPSWVFHFNQIDYLLRPSGAEGIGIDPPKDTWSFCALLKFRLP